VKPIDKAILWMVSEPPGRNATEPIGGLDRKQIRRPSPPTLGEGSMTWSNLTVTPRHSGGVVGAAR